MKRRILTGSASLLAVAIGLFFAARLAGNAQTGRIHPLSASPTLAARLPAPRIPTREQFRAAFPGDARSILEHGHSFTVLALQGAPSSGERHSFHGYPVLGGARVTNDAIRAALLSALYTGIAEEGPSAGCFVPRHGIRAVRGSRTVDLLICFSCGHLYVRDGRQEAHVGISNSAEAAFEQALQDAGVSRSRG